jgi:serine/threonine-protein kinase
LTGQLPYPGKNPRELFQQLLSKPPIPLNQASKTARFSPEIEAAVMTGLERDLGKRWKTVCDFSEGLVQAATQTEKTKPGFLSSFLRRMKSE